MTRYPVQRLPYSHDIRVDGRFLRQPEHGVIGLIGHVQKEIPPAYAIKNRFALLHGGAGHRYMGRNFSSFLGRSAKKENPRRSASVLTGHTSRFFTRNLSRIISKSNGSYPSSESGLRIPAGRSYPAPSSNRLLDLMKEVLRVLVDGKVLVPEQTE